MVQSSHLNFKFSISNIHDTMKQDGIQLQSCAHNTHSLGLVMKVCLQNVFKQEVCFKIETKSEKFSDKN